MQNEFSVRNNWTINRRGPMRWILSHVRRNKLLILAVFMGAAGNALLSSAIPIYTGQAFNAIVSDSPSMNALVWAALMLILTQFIRSILQLGRNFGSEILGQRLERDARQELYASLLGKSMGFHDINPTGEIMARATNDVRELALMIAPGFNLVLGSGTFLIVPLIVAPSIHPALLATPILFLIGYVIAMYFYLRQLQPVTAAVRANFGRLNAGLTEAIEGIETVKGAAQEAAEVVRFEEKARNFRNAFVDQGRVEARFLPLLIYGVALGAALWHALYLYQRAAINIGDVVAYMGVISLLSFPTFVSLFSYSQAAAGISSARRILELLRVQSVLDQNEGGHDGQMRGTLRFENVTFDYSQFTAHGADEQRQETISQNGIAPTRPALVGLDFEIEAGKTLALVGQTGAGKSTVAKLVNRIYDVNAGRVLVDGIDVREWDLAALREQISIIEQDIFLFSRTIAENIAFGKPDAPLDAIQNSARAAQAHDFIMSFPDGYDTIVGERGTMLSGGQRQRIALARAFLTNPAILILDDSTSAIDSATEDQIQRAIEAASKGRTTILITHRLSQIRWADKIVVLRQGQVAAVGTHEELLAQSQAYRDIFARM